jgi:hypothetical protein
MSPPVDAPFNSEAFMPDRPLPSDNREARIRFWDKRYVVMGIVAACVLMAIAILGGGLFESEESTRQTGAPQSDPQTPAIGQASPEAPPAPRPDAIGPAAQSRDLPSDLQPPAITQPSPQAPPAPAP